MDEETLARSIHASVLGGESGAARRLAESALEAGVPPLRIMDHFLHGIREVGRLWEEGEYFLPELVSGAESVLAALGVLRPALGGRKSSPCGHVAVIGTVAGDIHDIGKSLVGTLLMARGFEVEDLGCDVPPEAFLSAVKERDASVVGISALLTTTMVRQREVVRLLEAAGLRSQVKVLVGGAPVTESWVREIGADGTAKDAVGAADLAGRLLGLA